MKLSTLMKPYFERELLNEAPKVIAPKVITSKLPIDPQKSIDWTIKENPSRFYRKFKFKSHEKFVSFITTLLEYEDKVKHNAKIIIGYPEVIIQVWTHKLDDITDMDREYVKEVEFIIEELQ